MNSYKIIDPAKRYLIAFLDVVMSLCIKTPPNIPKVINNILVIRLDNLGDLLMTRPLLNSLRFAYPNAQIDVMIRNLSLNILEKDNFVDHVYPQSFSRKELRNKRYDLIIEPRGHLYDIILARCLQPVCLIGFGDAGGGPLCNIPLFQVDQNPVIKNKKVCDVLNISYHPAFPDINIPKQASDIDLSDNRPIVICPFSSRREKDWPIKQFVKCAQILEQQGYPVLWVTEDQYKSRLLTHIGSDFTSRFLNPSQLMELVSVIMHASLLIAPDSAPIHIAGAVGTPSIALFLHEFPETWHPYKHSLHATLSGDSISIDHVVSKALNLLSQEG